MQTIQNPDPDFDIPMRLVPAYVTPAAIFVLSGEAPDDMNSYRLVSHTHEHAINSLRERKDKCVPDSEEYNAYMAAIRILIDAQHRVLLEGLRAERRNDDRRYQEVRQAVHDVIEFGVEEGTLAEVDGQIGLSEWVNDDGKFRTQWIN